MSSEKRCLQCLKKIDSSKKKFCSHSCGSRHWNLSHPEIYKPYMKKYIRNHYRENKERYCQLSKEWERNHPEIIAICKQIYYLRYKKKFPERIKANSKAGRMIIIPEGKMCVRCNEKPAKLRHHPDYSKPLDVELLCNKCHSQIHNLKGGVPKVLNPLI